MGARRPSAPRPQPCSLSQLGRSAPSPRRTDGPKRASGSCIVQKESLLGQQSTAPTRLGSGKQRKPFSAPALRSAVGKAGRGCPWLPGPYCFWDGVSSTRNPFPTGSPWRGSRIGHAKAFCAQAPAMPPETARPMSAEAPTHRRPKTSFWQLHCAKGKSPRAAINCPNAPQLRKATQAVFAPPSDLQRAKWGGDAPGSLGPAALLGVSDARNPRLMGSPSRGSRIVHSKAFWAQAAAMNP